ncbi:MAG: hypothetical protein ACP5GI_05140 [Sulfolobales archaeon]
MLCLDINHRKWIEAKTLDLSRKEVLGRNFYVSIPQDLGIKISKGIGVGRIAETYISGESAVGKIGLYEIDLGHPLCKLCPAEIEALIEIREQWINKPEIALLYELGTAYSIIKETLGSILILGESLSALATALVAEKAGVSVYTLKRRFPGIKTHQLTIDTWDEHRTRNIFIGGVLSDEERVLLEDKIYHARKISIYYHPMMRGSKMILSLGEHIVLKRPKKPVIKIPLLDLAKKLYRLAQEKYLYIIKPGESLPENTYVVIDFREKPRRKDASEASTP